jgi:uncharacterized membrane protein
MKELYQLLAETKEIQKQNNKYLKSISTAVSIIAVIFVIAAAFAAYYGISLQMILNRF